MAGLRKHIPLTFWAMMAGTLAITGVGISAILAVLRAFHSKGCDHRGGVMPVDLDLGWHMYGFAVGCNRGFAHQFL